MLERVVREAALEFIEVYRLHVDSKRRVSVPASYRRILSEADSAFSEPHALYLAPMVDSSGTPYLAAYPQSYYRESEYHRHAVERAEGDLDRLRAFTLALSPIDHLGRIHLPLTFRYTGRELIMQGNGNHFVIYDIGLYPFRELIPRRKRRRH